jgi:hypothetical protein
MWKWEVVEKKAKQSAMKTTSVQSLDKAGHIEGGFTLE